MQLREIAEEVADAAQQARVNARAFGERVTYLIKHPHKICSFRDAMMVACGTAVMPHAFNDFASVFMDLQTPGSGGAKAFILASAVSVAEISFVGVSAYFAAEPMKKATLRGLRAAQRVIGDFFKIEDIQPSARKIAFTPAGIFSDALTEALTASGIRYCSLSTGNMVVTGADAQSMDSVLSALQEMPSFWNVDHTVVSVLHPGDGVPSAVRKLPDGSHAALWVDISGTPLKAVGYDSLGAPDWVYSHVTGKISYDAQDMRDEPGFRSVSASMSAGCREAAEVYRETRAKMLRALDVSTHRLNILGDGTIMITNLGGRADSPQGVPAILTPEGRQEWRSDGWLISQKAAAVAAEEKVPSGYTL
jgi:hypothetical protein